MKLTYSFIGVFFVWNLVASQWYIVGLKGVSTDPTQFDSQTAITAIFEIVVMLVVAIFIGYAIAWYQQQNTIDQIKKACVRTLQNEKKQQDEMKKAAMRSVREMELNLVHTEAVLKADNQLLADESQRLKAALKEKDETVALLKDELQSIRPK
ncbi:MAG: hypothetical protein ORN54_08185, partial [Cyclobacteriaceae bacterium]|nr:hypothetical protein [Cyclobacteriaceae bacterium]